VKTSFEATKDSSYMIMEGVQLLIEDSALSRQMRPEAVEADE
jgi:hypothetical protein